MRISLLAFAAWVPLAAGCAGHDPLRPGAGADGPAPPDGPPWERADAAGDPVAALDLAPDLSPPDRPLFPEVGRDVRPDAITPGSGLDPSRPVASLSDAELGRLCDWGLGQLGGYGTTMVCTDGTQIRNSPSQAACIAGHDRGFGCTATVGDTEDCLRAVAASGCSQALFAGNPACRAMFTCQRA